MGVVYHTHLQPRATIMNLVPLLAALALLWTASYALYADRAGEVDWYQQYVGHVTWMRFEQIPGSRRKVLVANRNTVAALAASSGALIWRHGLSGIQAVLHNKNILITVSQSDTVMLHSWEADSGLVRWSTPTQLTYNDRAVALDNHWRPGGVSAILAGAKQELILVATRDKLAAFYTRSGKPAWSVDLPEGAEAVSLTCSGTTAELLYTASSKLSMTKYDTTAKGAVINSYSVTASKDVECCVPVGNNTIVCIISEKVIVYLLDSSGHKRIELKGWSAPASPEIIAPGAVQGQLRVGNSLIEMVDGGTVNLLCDGCTDGVGTGERQESVRVLVRRRGDNELLVKHWDETESQGSDEIVVSLPAGVQGHLERVAVFPFRKADGTRGLRCLMVLSDSSLVMIAQNGQVVWIKEESLSSVLAVELFDLPTAINAETAETIDTLLHSKGNPFYLAALRAKMQLTTASQFLQSLLDKGVTSLVHESSYEEMLRDQFNLRKIIVVATAAGKLFGLDSMGGSIVWRTHVSGLHPFESSGKLILYALRSSSHPPHSPMVAVLGTSNVCNSSMVAYLNPLTGRLEGEPVCLPYHVSQTTLLSLTDSTHQRVLLVLDDNNIPHCIPSSCDALVHSNTSSVFMFTAHLSSGSLRGMEVVGDSSEREGKLKSVEVWRTVFPVAREKIIYVATKNNEIVGSLGRPRADRSVQYKYLNPHLLAVITQSLEQTKPSLTMYLIDAVSGAIIHQTVHKHSSGPVGVVISENWVVYNYYNVVSRRNEIAVLELYDVRNHTESEWSSSSPAVLPVVTSQSYTISTSIRFLSSTITLRSITPKSLLLGLHSGHIAMLRKDLLDPRRNMTPTPDMMEDGLPEYIPVISLPPQLYINYNQTIEDIAGIYSASTGLESTSLVFAYGRDIFFTQVTPFKQYDLLAESFEKWLIAAVCGGLVFGSLVLSQLASRRMLKLLWK